MRFHVLIPLVPLAMSLAAPLAGQVSGTSDSALAPRFASMIAVTGYEQRMVEYLRESRGLPVPVATRKASEKQKKKDAVNSL